MIPNEPTVVLFLLAAVALLWIAAKLMDI